jgi:hypothetical protein
MSDPGRDSNMQQLIPIAPPPKASSGTTGKELVVVDGTGKASGGVKLREDEEDLEVKLRRIMENVPVRVSNTSGSSAGSGSGDFHQVMSPSPSHPPYVLVCMFLLKCSLIVVKTNSSLIVTTRKPSINSVLHMMGFF